MPSPAPQPESTLRAKALLCALRSRGTDAARLLFRHPNHAALAELESTGAAANPPTINDMLWHELPRLEAAAGLRPGHAPPATGRHSHAAALDYWHRRRRIALRSEWRTLLAELPNLWRVLIDLTPASVEELAVLLGLEMIAHAALGQPPKQVNELLKPLDDPQERQVITRMSELGGGGAVDGAAGDPVRLPREVTAAWEAAYRKGMIKRSGAKLLRSLALSLLTRLHAARLSQRQRTAAGRHCRSDLLAVLGMSRSSLPVPPAQLADVERMVLETLGRLRPATR